MKRKGIILLAVSIISFLGFSSLLVYSITSKKYPVGKSSVNEPDLIKLTLEDKVERLKNGQLALIEKEILATINKEGVPTKKAGPAKCKT